MRHVEFGTIEGRSEKRFHEDMKSLISLKSVEICPLTGPWPSGVGCNKRGQCELQAKCTPEHNGQ